MFVYVEYTNIFVLQRDIDIYNGDKSPALMVKGEKRSIRTDHRPNISYITQGLTFRRHLELTQLDPDIRTPGMGARMQVQPRTAPTTRKPETQESHERPIVP